MYGNPSEREYVVFDFDNTTAIFDIAEQLMIFQLETMSFGLTPEEFDRTIVEPEAGAPDTVTTCLRRLSEEYSSLYSEYGPFTPEGVGGEVLKVLPSSPLWTSFAIGMAGMYDLLQEYMTADEAYVWVLGWFSGMTEKQLYDLAMRSHLKYSSVETCPGTWKTDGKEYSWIDGISVTENMKELWKALHDNGFDIWVCSASPIMPVLAAVDAFGLHDLCRGVVAMTMSVDSTGRYSETYDYETGFASYALPDGRWEKGTLPTRVRTAGPGKVEAILNSIAPEYSCRGPMAGFMDSTGDFNFCTEFSSLKMCVCFNRADRKVTDGGGLIAETAVYERDVLGYDLRSANEAGDILYLLQGRDENGLRSFRPSNLTLKYGGEEPKLFRDGQNYAQLKYFSENSLSVREILETFSLRTEADDPCNPLGFRYGFLDQYRGYRSLP